MGRRSGVLQCGMASAGLGVRAAPQLLPVGILSAEASDSPPALQADPPGRDTASSAWGSSAYRVRNAQHL